MAMKRCKDCVADGLTTNRKMAVRSDGSLQPGPRCVTHHRAWKRRNRHLAHGRRLEAHFGITSKLYWAIHGFQGGRCAICLLATGKAKRLAVDHDHELAKTHDHPVEAGCTDCIRGLLCYNCNVLLGRYDTAAFVRAINYLFDPPARKVFNASVLDRGMSQPGEVCEDGVVSNPLPPMVENRRPPRH